MSIYQVQKCLFDYLRAREHAPKDQRPDIATIAAQGYDFHDDERKGSSRWTWGRCTRWGPTR